MVSCSQRDLVQAGLSFSVWEWCSNARTVAVALFFLAFSFALFFFDVAFALVAALAVSSFSGVAFFLAPRVLKRVRAERVEKDLPTALRVLATLLSANVPFHDCVGFVARGDDELSREFSRALRDMDCSSVGAALSSLSCRVDSAHVRRAVSHLVSVYERGTGVDALRKLADELQSLHLARAREYSGKLAVYSLVFVCVSAVFPALFQALVIVGTSFMDLGLTPDQALLVPAVVFPVLDVVVLGFIRLRKPVVA
ncbi:MAG: type II secretion system F family protein [Candidatus Diapherotrites archaeon]|nr:type II secretion system F family protein [Candidatus Diapherotrites archaeon]